MSCQHTSVLSPPTPCHVRDLQHPHAPTALVIVILWILCSSSRSLSWATFHRKQPIGSPKVNMALATRLYPLQPLLLSPICTPLPLHPSILLWSISRAVCWPKMSQHFAPWVRCVKWSWLQGNFHRVRACVCVSVYDPISQRYKAVWQGKRAVEPVIGNFKLLPAMHVRGKLYSNYNNTHTGGGGVWACIMTQYTVCSHWQEMVLQAGMWH